MRWIFGRSQNGLSYFTMDLVNCHSLGSPIAGVWLIQALSGRWRPERGWIDRLGRALGIAWIIVFLTAWWLELLST